MTFCPAPAIIWRSHHSIGEKFAKAFQLKKSFVHCYFRDSNQFIFGMALIAFPIHRGATAEITETLFMSISVTFWVEYVEGL